MGLKHVAIRRRYLANTSRLNDDPDYNQSQMHGHGHEHAQKAVHGV